MTPDDWLKHFNELNPKSQQFVRDQQQSLRLKAAGYGLPKQAPVRNQSLRRAADIVVNDCVWLWELGIRADEDLYKPRRDYSGQRRLNSKGG